jgi:hypothetical protein
MYAHSITVPSWSSMPNAYKHDAMERLAPGLYGHRRISTVFVVMDELNSAPSEKNLGLDMLFHDRSNDAERNLACALIDKHEPPLVPALDRPTLAGGRVRPTLRPRPVAR